MSSSDLRDRMDGLQWDVPITKLETIMPGSSFLTYSRGENVDIFERSTAAFLCQFILGIIKQQPGEARMSYTIQENSQEEGGQKRTR